MSPKTAEWPWNWEEGGECTGTMPRKGFTADQVVLVNVCSNNQRNLALATMEQLEWPVQKWPEQENVKWYKDREVKFNEPENCLRQTYGTFQNDTQAESWLQDKKEENKEAFFH